MKTDLPLKTLFQHHAADLLVLTGDEGAVVESAAPVEIPARELRVDTVLRLRRGGEVYYRHVEFQARWRRGTERRFFEYNVQLTLRLGWPVLTTVLWLFPPGPRGERVFRVVVGGREVNRWRYDSVRLWEVDAEPALRGAPALAALAPLLRGGGDKDVIAKAARRIESSAPAGAQPGLLAVLSALLGRRYTFEEILDLVGRQAMIESNFLDEMTRRRHQQGLEQGWAKGLEEGIAKGASQGQLDEDRRLCLDMVRAYHPRIASKVRAGIQGCANSKRLRTWILRAPRLSDAEFVRLVRQG